MFNTENACMTRKSVSHDHILTLNCTMQYIHLYLHDLFHAFKAICNIMSHFTSVHPLCKRAIHQFTISSTLSTPQISK